MDHGSGEAAGPGSATATAGDPARVLLLGLLRRGTGRSAVLLLTVLTGTACALLLPAALARAVDAALTGGSTSHLVPFLLLLLVGTAADALAQFADPWATTHATADLSRRLITRIIGLGTRATARFQPGDLVTRLVAGTAEAALAPAAVIHTGAELLCSTGALIALALIDPWSAAALLLGAPLGAAAVRRFLRQVAHGATAYLTAQAALAERLVEALGGLRTIRAGGLRDAEAARVLTPLPELNRAGRAIWQSQRQVQWRTSLLAPALQVAVLAVAGQGAAAGRITPGEVLAVLAYSTTALGLLSAAQSLLALARARAGAARTAEVLAVPAPAPGTRPLPPGPGELLLDAVTVRRGGRTVLDRLTLRVPAGATVALVGRSGSGKSTVAALAGGLTEPDEGRVTLDGIPLPEARPADLRRAVGYAFARPVLLGTTIADAVAYTDPVDRGPGGPGRQASAETFVDRLPTDPHSPHLGRPGAAGPDVSGSSASGPDPDAPVPGSIRRALQQPPAEALIDRTPLGPAGPRLDRRRARPGTDDQDSNGPSTGKRSTNEPHVNAPAPDATVPAPVPDPVRWALRQASAEAFVDRLPAGPHTPLADAPLSGGERQRLGLARAIAHGGRLTVLDDATSSLDTATEAEVTRALADALRGRTRLLVAHRATAAAGADLVAWLDAGRVRALAPHRELWSDPAYRALFAPPPPQPAPTVEAPAPAAAHPVDAP
ncbi:ABC transporter ATP-binding protein [Kitasatospora sp. NPDC093806]|uniref:ABC transporter ATP-binding protein n=1 Tax=Kitasatospora sp. NPDC093806 TaxID=3155075 RepID=UPI003426694F